MVALVEQNAIELDPRNVCHRTAANCKVAFRAVGWRVRERDCECRVGDLSSFGESCFDARSRGVNDSRGRAASDGVGEELRC